MNKITAVKYYLFLIPIFLFAFFILFSCLNTSQQTVNQKNEQRIKWWQEARFGMFIHWGLYSIPAGEWKDQKNHAEWIRHTAHIPIETYDKFVDQFNPVKFNAEDWVRMAKDAGMKYIVITSKHHDGFCLFDSKYTDFDIMSTPFKRDIMKELSDACQNQGLKMCWYHSIMDWHHPDYLPRRDWEDRSAEGADFNRYVKYLQGQVTELLTNYGDIGVMWFDGEWEGTWNHEYGKPLYDLCRELQPDVIVNDRVDKGRQGHSGVVKENYAGDFGTPEQQIPATGLPGVDWETCMTMNRHWGYNKFDKDFKSTKDLIQKLADIASKGGNFLLNIGPTAEGFFPQESIDRLSEIGEWMKVNSEAIYGTKASPFKYLEWGRCTQKVLKKGITRLYLHVFNWPKNGVLVVPGIFNESKNAFLLSDANKNSLKVTRKEDALLIDVPESAPDENNSVVVLDIISKADISEPPEISAENDIFINELEINISTDRKNVEMFFTTDGSTPTIESSVVNQLIKITETTVFTARSFRDGKPVSGNSQKKFFKVEPVPSEKISKIKKGIGYEYFEGDWDRLPDFNLLQAVKSGVVPNFVFSPRNSEEHFGFRYEGFIKIPKTGIYKFYTDSDDGSQLFIGKKKIVNNDGLHGSIEEMGSIPLEAGFHPIIVTFFEKSGGDKLDVFWSGPSISKVLIPDEALFFSAASRKIKQ